jgi:nitroreductase
MTEIHELISKRWSPVAFDPRPVEYDKIQLLFDAAKWAPSANNNQPWRFIFATKDMPEYEVFLSLMAERNRIWASTAPLLVMGLAQVVSTYKNRPNRLAFYEAGMAVSNLLLQATAMDLYVHQMSGYDHERAKELFVIPSRYEPASILAIGYKGDPSLLPEDLASQEEQERSRMQISDFLITGRCK